LGYAISGTAAGLAGSILVLDLGAWSNGMSAGKGWIALAAVFLGKQRFPGLALAIAVLSVGEVTSNALQGQGLFPQELSLSIPFILAFLVLLFPVSCHQPPE
jgi:simple sugar transport system permease protein